MPANKKYLTKSPLHKILKITSGFIGGYLITITFFAVLLHFFDAGNVLFTLRFMGFLFWTALLLLAFLAKSGWKILGIYTAIYLILKLLLHFLE